MKVRWRQHEIIFASIVLVIAIKGFWWRMMQLPAAQFSNTYKLPFTSNRLVFDFYRNLLLPQAAIFLIIYIAVLWVNLFIVPRLITYKNADKESFKIKVSYEKKGFELLVARFIKKYVWLFIQVSLLVIFMGTALNVVAYFLNEYNFHYPEFSFFPGNGHHAGNLMNLQEGYENAGAFLTGYGIYILCRELIIRWIERSGSKRNFRVLICNQVTVFAVVFVSIPYFVASFNLVGNTFFNAYYAIGIPLLMLFMLNTYWLFPLTDKRSFLTRSFALKLLLSCLVCSLPFGTLSFGNDGSFPVYVFLCWIVLLLVATPVTWLLFQQRRDKIIQLRGVEKELVKSTTNLQSLRAQINPHFLYNILNTLYGTALQENADRTANGIQQLGDMMRFMLDENHLDYIPMSREIEYLNNYIALQKLRLPADAPIIIESNISDTNCNHKIAPMLLIPFVENAFKHGISLNTKSWIKIALACDEKNIHFEVRNSMHPKAAHDPEKERSGIGLINVVERLKLIYPGKFQFSVNGDGAEYFVILNIETTN
ncbi:MAG: histidine kinase [Bacteroidota bacterium]